MTNFQLQVERVSVEYVFQHNPFLLFYIKQGKSFCFSKLCKQFGSPTSTLDGLEVHCDLSNDLENRSSCDDLKNRVEETLREAGECSQRLSDEHAPFDDDQDFAQEHEPCSSDRSRSGETETCKPSSSDKRFDETEISSHPFSPQNDVIKTAVCESSDLPGYSKQKLRSLDFVADEVYGKKRQSFSSLNILNTFYMVLLFSKDFLCLFVVFLHYRRR